NNAPTREKNTKQDTTNDARHQPVKEAPSGRHRQRKKSTSQ
ncbi:1433_t:CDS:1, partial [Dentiscutata erythropus]